LLRCYLQLWVNLPAAHKMDPPAYQDVRAALIPHFSPAPGVRAKVIAGCVFALCFWRSAFWFADAASVLTWQGVRGRARCRADAGAGAVHRL
jgi:redox-sensitive bicupin YhaK (pirin superfamily)